MRGATMRRKHERELALWMAWHVEAFARTKKLPAFASILEKMNGPKEMTPQQQRAAIIGIAQTIGATVRKTRKGDTVN